MQGVLHAANFMMWFLLAVYMVTEGIYVCKLTFNHS